MRGSQIAVIAVTLLVVGNALAWQFATAQADKPMVQHWEYKAFEGGTEKAEQLVLERAGNDGWELVAVEPADRRGSPWKQRIFYFKRPK